MSDREAFLRTIVENPDDDVSRLVFADWLEENGEPERAAFVRIQCELASLLSDDERREECELNALRLYRGNREKWLKELPKLVGVKWGKFDRGFVSEIGPITPTAFGRNVERMFAVTPLQSLRIDMSNATVMNALQRIPDYVRLREFMLGNTWYLTPAQERMRPLLTLPAIRRTRRLDLTSVVMEDRSVRSLGESGECAWEELRIRCAIASAPFAVLFDSPTLPYLHTLRLLIYGGSSNALLESLIALNTASKIRSLHMEGFQFGARGGAMLRRIPCLALLESLTIERGGFSNQSMIDLSTAANMPHLRSLSIVPNATLSEGCLNGLRKGGLPQRLNRFSLSAILGDSGFAKLLDSGTWEQLEHLRIHNRSLELGDESLARLCDSKFISQLRSLQIIGGQFGLKIVNRLIEMELPKLRKVCISNLTPKGRQNLNKRFGPGFTWF